MITFQYPVAKTVHGFPSCSTEKTKQGHNPNRISHSTELDQTRSHAEDIRLDSGEHKTGFGVEPYKNSGQQGFGTVGKPWIC